MEIIESIAKYIEESSYDSLSTEVIDKVKVILLDTLGVGLGGFKTKPGKIVVDVIKNLGGKRESTIIGDGTKVNCVHAGYANTYLVDIMDYEETYAGLCHPNASVVPSAMAVGERVKASGKDIMNAIVIGNEIAIRVGLAMHPSRERIETGASAYTWHCFGSAATACKLLHLKTKQIMNAFGFTGCSTALPTSITKWNRPLGWVKNNLQRQTDAGILGALMAQRGFAGPIDILESDLGFWRMAGSDRCDYNLMKDGLGEEYHILKASLKPYPACRWIHATLDAVSEIIKEKSFKSEEIDQIRVEAVSELKWFVDYEPKSLVDAEFSVPYTVAMLILGYKPGLEWFKERTLKDPKVLSLAKKVLVESTPEVDKIFYDSTEKSTVQMAGSTVDIVLKDGRRFSKYIDVAKVNLRGSPENPIDPIEKFRNCVLSAGIKPKQSEKIITAIDKLEGIDDIAKLTKLLKIS